MTAVERMVRASELTVRVFYDRHACDACARPVLVLYGVGAAWVCVECEPLVRHGMGPAHASGRFTSVCRVPWACAS